MNVTPKTSKADLASESDKSPAGIKKMGKRKTKPIMPQKLNLCCIMRPILAHKIALIRAILCGYL